MIHINRGDGKHEFLTKKEYEARYGQLPDTNGQLAEQAKSLRMARIEARVTLRELAKEMGVRPSWLSGLEHGREEITIEDAARHSNALTAIGLREEL